LRICRIKLRVFYLITVFCNRFKARKACRFTLIETRVLPVAITITGASVEGEGFKPRNLLPISAAIKLASNATDTNNKTPVLVVELKFTDSVSGKLLSESLSTISGSEFRDSTQTVQQFTQLAQQWVQQVLKYSLANNP
jgi:Protein of unknown function (DUF3313)